MTPRRLVDAHLHFWDLSRPRDHPWIPLAAADDPAAGFLRRDYLPVDYLADAAGLPVVGLVHVEAGWDRTRHLAETRWLTALLQGLPTPYALVAGAELQKPRIATELASQRGFPAVAGVRQMLDWDPAPQAPQPPALLGDPDWEAGLRAVAEAGLAFDLQVVPEQLGAAAALAGRHPDVVFVLNHAGLRGSRPPGADPLWAEGIVRLAVLPNTRVKMSGYGGIDPSWNPDGFRDRLRRVLDAFGPGRCCFASNFPFDRETIALTELVALHAWALDDLEPEESDAYFAGTAATIYGLSV